MANNFFNDSNKAYSENLNDGILVGNAFDWTVSIGLPSDTDGVFPSSSDVVMAKVADVSITPNSNLSIGSTITNRATSAQVYRLTVYPNFNRFGGFKSISLTADSGVTFYVANKGGNSPIASNLDYSDLSNVPELKVLKEYDIVITIPANGEVTGLGFVFQSSRADVSSSIKQSNVLGLDNTITAIQEKDTQQDVQIADLINANDKIFNYDLLVSDYNPTINEDIVVSCKVTDFYGVEVAGESFTLKRNGTTVGTSTTNLQGVATWNVTCDEWGLQVFRVENTSIQVNVTGWKQIAEYSANRITLYSDGKWGMITLGGTWSNSTTGEVVLGIIDSEYSPFSNVSTNYSYASQAYQPVYTKGTNICINRIGTGEYSVYCTLYFRLANPKY